MDLIILKWQGGKLVVDEDSLHHFGNDIPKGKETPQGVYELKVKSVKQLK